MSSLKLPPGADAGFHYERYDAFGNRFSIYIYGARRQGWFVAMREWFGGRQDAGPQALARGQWREFLGLVKQAGYWELPERLPEDPNLATDDGEWLYLEGREGERAHHVHRGTDCFRPWMQIGRFLRAVSGLYPEVPPAPAPIMPQATDGD